MHILWRQDHADDIVDRFRHTLDTGEPYVAPEQTEERRDRGVVEYYEWQVHRVPLPGGHYGAVCYFRDIAPQVHARETVRSALVTAETANRAKSDFLTAMSHELRTPLNAIAGHVQLLQMGVHGPLAPAQHDALVRVAMNQQHSLSVITDILNFAKLEAGRVEYDLQDVVLAEAVDGVGAMMESQVTARGLVYESHVAPDVVVRADRDKLQQILVNILSNALKFTPSGGRIVADLPSRADAPDGCVFLRIADTGVGITRGKQDAIFEPFVQIQRSLTRPTEGTGLGLAISRELARGVGGNLRVRSTEGAGARFTLTLQDARVRCLADGRAGE